MNSLARRAGIYSLAAVAAASCGAAATPTAPASSSPAEAPAALRRIVVLGDSLSVSPSRSVNFPADLQTRLDSTVRGWTVHNAGVSGDTTTGGVRRLDDAIAGDDTRVLILALGANDGLRGVSLATVEANLSAIIERAQARRIQVLLCGMETPPSHGWNYTIGFHQIFPRLAARYNIPLVPFLLAGVALDPEFNGDDAIHPNAAGARRIGETVWPYLELLVRNPSAATYF
jgi:acyl-CoA thioesterase-1